MPPKITECMVSGEPVNIWHPEKNSDLPYDGYSISYGHGGWMTGTYDSIESAKEGARLCFIDESKVANLSDEINHFDRGNRAITLEDLKGVDCD
jgi:hypothetical protein